MHHTERPKHVTYAINSIHAACNKPVAVVACSQGNLATPWSLKYWPRTRKAVNNFIALSADFHGTIQALIVMPFSIGIGNPSAWSQKKNSHFVTVLRDDGGDSAYVLTTSVFSSTDGIVRPQSGEVASAWMKDARNVGVTNCELQRVAPLTPAGFIYSHETILSNPISWALAEDAIKNGGPGKIERIGVNGLCMRFLAEGLNFADGVATEALLPMAGASIAGYLGKVMSEPQLPAYALAKMKVPLAKVDTGKPATGTETEMLSTEVH